MATVKKKIGIERRQSVRAKRVLSIQYRPLKTKTKDIASENWSLSTTNDMSLDGLTFYSDIPLREGDQIEVHVVMSGILDIFTGKAKVIRIEESDPGILFVALKFNLRKTHQTTRKAKSFSGKQISK